ncbi:MAG: competence/damage-inducible protein A [Thermoanaerobaculia bacterium]
MTRATSTAAIIAVGSELLGTRRLDTNSLRLTEVLERHGVDLIVKSVVGDDRGAIASELRRRMDQAGVVILTGGLGPTADDVTRAGVAELFDRGITVDEELVERFRRLFEKFGRRMAEVNRRQAEVIDGAEVLTNTAGLAPGLLLEEDGTAIFLFPGVPRELEAMIDKHLEPWLRARQEASGVATGVERRVLKVASMPESEIEERITAAYERFGRESISVLSSPGEVKLWMVARGPEDERRRRLDEMASMLAEAVGTAVFTDRQDDDLETVVGRLLRQAGRTVTTAESCTGGLAAERLTRVAGSSDYFLGGIVSYTNELKVELLGVPAKAIADHGAVSEPVARAMADGVRSRYGSDHGIGITGVAGPGGGSEDKPVGTVHVAVAGPDGVDHRKVCFPGDRQRIRSQSAQLALEMLRRQLL